MTCFGYGSVLFAVTGAKLFAQFYHFDVAQTGLILSIPLLIGSLIGEFNAGWLTDWMVYRKHLLRFFFIFYSHVVTKGTKGRFWYLYHF